VFRALRSSAFPATAQGQEQIDLAHRDLGIGRRQLRAHVGVGTGGLQVGEEGRTPGLEEAVGLVRRLLRRLLGVCQGLAALQLRAVLGQAGLVSRMALSTTPSKCARAPWLAASAS